MVFGFFKSLNKSKKLVEYSQVLSNSLPDFPTGEGSFSDFILSMGDRKEKEDAALQGIIDLAFNDEKCLAVIQKHNITREQMEEKYRQLLMSGAGQVVKNHWVAASALVYDSTLDFLFDAPNIYTQLRGRDLLERVAYQLIVYFDEGRVGAVLDN